MMKSRNFDLYDAPPRNQVYMWYQWTLCVILNFIDYYVTKCYTIKAGVDGEFNPLMHWIIDHTGTAGMLYTKMGWLLFLGGMMLIIPERGYTKIGDTLACLNIVLGVVIGWGIYCLLSLV